jgi:hypothetical protein
MKNLDKNQKRKKMTSSGHKWQIVSLGAWFDSDEEWSDLDKKASEKLEKRYGTYTEIVSIYSKGQHYVVDLLTCTAMCDNRLRLPIRRVKA